MLRRNTKTLASKPMPRPAVAGSNHSSRVPGAEGAASPGRIGGRRVPPQANESPRAKDLPTPPLFAEPELCHTATKNATQGHVLESRLRHCQLSQSFPIEG